MHGKVLGCLVLMSAMLLVAHADEKPVPVPAPAPGPAPGPATDPVRLDENYLRDNRVPTDGAGLLAFVRSQVVPKVSEAQIRELVEKLGDDSFQSRQEASRALNLLGLKAKKHLQTALTHADPEVKYRAAECLEQIDALGPQLSAAAIRLLGHRQPAGTVELLLDVISTVGDDPLGDEARTVLTTLAVKDDKPSPVLLAALADRVPVRRAAAGVALASVRNSAGLPAVRKLLEDPQPQVRLLVAMELARLKHKEAIPVLIDHMDRPAERYAAEAEEQLTRLAGEKTPAPPQEGDLTRYRDAWRAWWKENENKVDLALLNDPTRQLGRTVVVLLDDNQVVSLDRASRVRWKIEGVQMPLDIQPLPGDRVLLAEHKAGRVTERNSKGEVVWDYRVEEPLVAQRLPNGNTFIATKERFFEVDRMRREVASPRPRFAHTIMRARKLSSGDTLLITQLGGPTRFIRLDPTLKEVCNVPVDVGTSGGRLDLTTAGNVLIPEMDLNRVVEMDLTGKRLRLIPVAAPIAAVALPDGGVIVTTMTENRAVELDRTNKEVWQYRRDKRVTRAVRY